MFSHFLDVEALHVQGVLFAVRDRVIVTGSTVYARVFMPDVIWKDDSGDIRVRPVVEFAGVIIVCVFFRTVNALVAATLDYA